jgi:acetyl-CoA C-acetyltransferase
MEQWSNERQGEEAMKGKEVVIVSMARTAIGDFQGAFKDVSAVDLGVAAAQAALDCAGLRPDCIDECVTGIVYKAGAKGNPSRQIQLKLGIPEKAGALTVDQQCASSMRALEIAMQQIKLGNSKTALVTGIESMSNVPYLVMTGRKGFRMGDAAMSDGLLYDALVDAFLGYHMGITAETLAEKYRITREEQDSWAALSHERAVAAIDGGLFKEEIVPFTISSRKGDTIVDTDEHPRADVTRESLAKLKPAFKKDGTVTAGNSSGVNDGAAALVVMSEEKADELGVAPVAKILSTATYGVKPEVMGIGPICEVPLALDRAGKAMSDVDYFEINEAFAAQFLSCQKELGIPDDSINLRGSGISLGHPVGCTGIRIIISAIQELRKRGGKTGVASLCAGGGPGMATVVQLY